MAQFAILVLTLFFALGAFADDTPIATKAETKIVINETIVHEQSLAEHMGWDEDKDAEFKAAPRNFRTEQLNSIKLESDEDTNSITDNR